MNKNAESVFILFPNHLFKDVSPLNNASEIWLVEEYLYFGQYAFHKQKLLLHRASMKYYQDYLTEKGFVVKYTDAKSENADVRKLIPMLKNSGITELHHYELSDDWLQRRLVSGCSGTGIKRSEYDNPSFINTVQNLEGYFAGRTKYFQTDFYIQQRKKLRILLDAQGKPQGGKWSFDADNREKYPKGKKAPAVIFPDENKYYREAEEYVSRHFADNYGDLTAGFRYPVTHTDSEKWLDEFLISRFREFGAYEDAMVSEEKILHHSLLSPLMNCGLLTPVQVIDAALESAVKNDIPLNTVEGFVRQIIGWREFIRGVYLHKGRQERTSNFFGAGKKIPEAFYTGKTGIEPIDATIRKVLETGYCHHIERLMILGNFMLLCEFHPDEVYRWFMEMFVDAYDWVMVTNVYGMSQFADGGLMATKPYISGSSYVLKMSNYQKGSWCGIWDAHFWHFMNRHRSFFSSNPRLGMLLKTYDKMSDEKKAGFDEKVKEFRVKMGI